MKASCVGGLSPVQQRVNHMHSTYGVCNYMRISWKSSRTKFDSCALPQIWQLGIHGHNKGVSPLLTSCAPHRRSSFSYIFKEKKVFMLKRGYAQERTPFYCQVA